MSDTTEYRVEYFNKANKVWMYLRTKTPPTPENWAKLHKTLKENAQGVQFRLAMRTCTPWCECQVREGSK